MSPVRTKANKMQNKQVTAVKSGRGSKATSPATSRAQSVASSTAPARSKGKKK